MKGDFTLYIFYLLYTLDCGNVLLVQSINKTWNKLYLAGHKGTQQQSEWNQEASGSLNHWDDWMPRTMDRSGQGSKVLSAVGQGELA